MNIHDRINQEIGLDLVYEKRDNTLFSSVNCDYDEVVARLINKSYIYNRVFKHSTHDFKFIYRWFVDGWQEFIVSIKRGNEGLLVEIIQATNNVATDGGVING